MENIICCDWPYNKEAIARSTKNVDEWWSNSLTFNITFSHNCIYDKNNNYLIIKNPLKNVSVETNERSSTKLLMLSHIHYICMLYTEWMQQHSYFALVHTHTNIETWMKSKLITNYVHVDYANSLCII